MTSNITDSAGCRSNNLGKSSSPYLLQHAENPVWWQEWSRDVLDLAIRENKPLLVSVGYSTCHWCHVMAAEAFSDKETADFLNENFICLKVDREKRPDIDQFMMNFIQAQSGSGGWPLNVFLTPDLKPVVAITYAPAKTDDHRLSLLEIAFRVREYLKTESDRIAPFHAMEKEPPVTEESLIVKEISSYYDEVHAGFGTGQKFPPHSILLFLLHHLSVNHDPETEKICTSTLDAMILGGLNDHLQGGIFRYCVDRRWTIPHFEKMLYDQALALCTYSLAYKVTASRNYKNMAGKILKCLEECFEDDGLYLSAFNADTDHEEGATYIWTWKEIEDLLSKEDFKRFCNVYLISKEGNFEGKNHLIRKNNDSVQDIEDLLLSARKRRKQPSADTKIISGLNALAAVALIAAGRYLEKPRLEAKAEGLIKKLLAMFWDGTSLGHSYFNGSLQQQGFLSDAGAMLLAVTMLYENNEQWGGIMYEMSAYVRSFKEEGRWIESRAEDFQAVYASWTDQPVPSGVSLAETGLARHALLTGMSVNNIRYRRPLQCDFYNINALMCNDLFHLYTTRKPHAWKNMPANSLQKRGEPETVCFNKVCRTLQ